VQKAAQMLRHELSAVAQIDTSASQAVAEAELLAQRRAGKKTKKDKKWWKW
jgi:hypothetical protein